MAEKSKTPKERIFQPLRDIQPDPKLAESAQAGAVRSRESLLSDYIDRLIPVRDNSLIYLESRLDLFQLAMFVAFMRHGGIAWPENQQRQRLQ